VPPPAAALAGGQVHADVRRRAEGVPGRRAAEGQVEYTSAGRDHLGEPAVRRAAGVVGGEPQQVLGDARSLGVAADEAVPPVLGPGAHAGPVSKRPTGALFEDDSFVETNDENYTRIEEVARDLGLVGG
jgi:hypothetical protein